MVNLSPYQTAAKNFIENFYIGLCDIIQFSYLKNPVTNISEKSENVLLSNIPCRVSFHLNNNSRLNITSAGDTSAAVKQNIKLFISPHISIKPGSKIVVTQNGVTTAYKNSGQPSIYSTHQEIMLELFHDLA